ncbi:penicillin-binding transpeptidase domain-containing protein, partial [Bifidobacterium vansinderenii]
PFALLATVQKGVNLSTTFNGNSPRSFPGLTQAMNNAGGVSYGYIDLYKATANSVNTVYMDLAQHLGSQTIIDTAKTAGIKGTIANDSYTVLGNSGLTVYDMVRGYSTIANQGQKVSLHIVNKVTDGNNKDLYKSTTTSERVFDANDVALVTKAMTGTIKYGTGKEANSIGLTMAGKSGTANDSKAASFVGFTPSVLTYMAIWYPGDGGTAEEVPTFAGYSHGSGYPAHMFTKYMKQALSGAKDEEFPTAKDDGTIGGSDGTWGTGSKKSSSSSSSGTTNKNKSESSDTTDEGTSTGTENSGGTNGGTGSSTTGGSTSTEGTTGTESGSGSTSGTTGGTGTSGGTGTGTENSGGTGTGGTNNNGGTTNNNGGTTNNNGGTVGNGTVDLPNINLGQ